MKRISTDTLAGILITVCIHLAVIIVLLMSVVEPKLLKEKMNIELDFSEQEKLEKLESELARQKALNEKPERML